MHSVKDEDKKKSNMLNDMPFERHYKNPNELGRVHMSISKQQVYPVEVEYIGDAMAQSKKSKKDIKNKIDNIDSTSQNVDKKAIDDIWKHLGLGHIDISYACVGYTMDGRAILNHDEFVNLLINYGFDINVILDFIEDFALHGANDNKSPIVMLTTNTTNIMANIKPIV